jgi:hypothetical protein
VTNYTKSTNFASKDSLAVGNPLKIVKGTEIDAEFNNIATSSATKADLTSPMFVGSPSRNANPPQDDSSFQLATTNWVQNELATEVIAINAAKAPKESPTFTGVPEAPTAAVDTNTTQLATTAFVVAQAATVAPLANGTAAIGTSKKYARQDHVHAVPLVGASAIAANATVNVFSGGTGQCLITLHAKASSSFGVFGARTVGISIGGTVVASTVITTIEFEGRTVNVGASVSYLYTGSGFSTIPVTYSSSGGGNAEAGFISYIGL